MENFVVDSNIAYDVVELPSRGIYYPNNKTSVKVAYLTAPDEDILSSPNLVQTNAVISEILKRKVLDKDIDTNDLVDVDVQAILIFLRNTAYGSNYVMNLIDPKTNENFEDDVDLSTLEMKPFELLADSNGEYAYTFEKTKIDITFKFLTKKQEDEIEIIKKSWNGIGQPPSKTKELEFMIKSAKGTRDMMTIRNMIQQLPIADSQNFRKFVNDNRPGLNLKRTAIAPSGEKVEYIIGFGVEFFRPFFGI